MTNIEPEPRDVGADDDRLAVRWSFIAALFPLALYTTAGLEEMSRRGMWPNVPSEQFYGWYLLLWPLALIGGWLMLTTGLGVVERRRIVLCWILPVVVPPFIVLCGLVWMLVSALLT